MAKGSMFTRFSVLAVAAAVACTGDRVPLSPERASELPAAASIAPSLAQTGDRAGRPGPAVPPVIGEASAILRTQPLAADLSASATIGPNGGVLNLPAAGLRVQVPRGALTRPTTLTVTALKGDMLAYEFGPHGTRFNVPLLVLQDARNTSLDALPDVALLQVGYFTGPEMLDRGSKRARLAELLPTYGLKVDSTVGFIVTHFSGYIFTWGFKSYEQD